MDDFERSLEYQRELAEATRRGRPRVDGPRVTGAARELRAALARPGRQAPAGGSRGGRGRPAPVRAGAGHQSPGVRPDGRRVTTAEKRAILARFGGQWSRPGPGLAARMAGLQAELAGRDAGRAGPYGW